MSIATATRAQRRAAGAKRPARAPAAAAVRRAPAPAGCGTSRAPLEQAPDVQAAPAIGLPIQSATDLPVQAKVAIGAPGDPYEQEADQAATAVVDGGPVPQLSPVPATPGGPTRRAAAAATGGPTIGLQRMTAGACPGCGGERPEPQTTPTEEAVQLTPQAPEGSVQMAPADEPLQTAVAGDGVQSAPEIPDEPFQMAPVAEPAQAARTDEPAQMAEARPAGTASSGAEPAVSSRMAASADAAIRNPTPGHPMHAGTRSAIESQLSVDLGAVRVHDNATDRRAGAGAGARAFTHGSDIWLGPSERQTDLGLMAHESAHVVQQGEAEPGRPASGAAARAAAPPVAAQPAPTAATGAAVVAHALAEPSERTGSGASGAPGPAAGRGESGAAGGAPGLATGAGGGGGGAGPELLMPEPPEGLSAADRERLAQVDRRAGVAADANAALPSADESVGEAQGAVEIPAEETEARAEGALAAELGARPEPSAGIEQLCERIVAVIHSRQPPDEASLVESSPRAEAAAAGSALESAVEGDAERVEGDYGALEEAPEGEAPREAQDIENPPESVETPDPGAAGAVPGAVPAEDVSLDADVAAGASRMQDAGMESEPAQLVESGPIAEAREAQGELAETAQRDPAEVLAEQRAARESASADMATLQAQALEALRTGRTSTITDVGGQQQGMVGTEEQMRTQASAQANAIFTSAQSRVESLLEPLPDTAMRRWETGVDLLSTRFEQALAQVRSWLDERYSGVGGAVLEFAESIVGKPAWVTNAYNRAEQEFADGVCGLIREISTEVNGVIAACETIIDDANTQIAELFASLPESLQEWAAGEQAGFAERLDGLQQQVTATQQDLTSGLAERAAESVQQVREQIHELRQAARGLVGRIEDAVNAFLDDPAKFIIEGLLELVGIPPASFWALIDRMGQVINDIADDPMGFANNLVSAIGQGFQRFFDNFADHIVGGFFDWLFSGLGAVGVTIPSDFSLKSIITFALELMGITWARIRQVLARHIGEENVALIEKAYELIATLIEQGPEGIFEMIKEQLNPQAILDQIIQAAVDFLIGALIRAVTPRIIALFNPAGAIVQAVEIIFRVLKWIFDNAARIFSLVETVVNGAADLIAGNISGMATAVEGALARLIAPVIDFLAGFLGLGSLPDRIADTIRGFQEMVLGVIDRVVEWLAQRARALLRALGLRDEEEEDEEPLEDDENGVKARARSLLGERLTGEMPVSEVQQVVSNVHAELRSDGLHRLELEGPDSDGGYRILSEASPITELMGLAPDSASVTMGVTIRLREESEPRLPDEGIARTTGYYEPSEGQREILGSRRVASISAVTPQFPMSARDWRAYRESGGLIIEPEAGSRELQMVTWSTGASIRGTNVSHAERQFVDWFTDRLNRDWRRRVEHVSIVLSHSPCGNCTRDLVYAMRVLQTSSPGATGDISWSDLHRGQVATTPSDIDLLEGAEWNLSGPMPERPEPVPPIRRVRGGG